MTNDSNYQLYSFPNFPGCEQMPTYSEAEAQLKSLFQLLKYEILDFYFPSKLTIPSHNDFHIYATNWALRFIFDPPLSEASLFRNFVIPLKTIVRIEKVRNFGIKFHLSTGCHLHVKFPESEGIRREFKQRIKMLKKNSLKFDEQKWITNPTWIEKVDIPSEYDLMWNKYCKTYPRYFFMPSKIPTYFIHESSLCRTHKRFPFITYFYVPLKSDEEEKVALLRCSQPVNVLKRPKSVYEHQYLAAICGNHGLTIIDCRPKKKAFANQMIGKGYESTKDVKMSISKVHFHFLGIPDYSDVRDRYISMVKKIFHGKSSAFKKWGKITMKILNGASLVVSRMTLMLNTVLIHCSNGLDRTSQICSLSQLMMDSKFRTLKGFIELIQKDWIDIGHKFSSRCLHVRTSNYNLASPIFAMFIDAVAQIMNKYPTEFEFNLTFLEIILSNVYSQLFGDFVGNNYNERMQIDRATSLFLCFDDESFGLLEKVKNDSFEKSDKILLMEKKEKYHFFPELIGTPAFFSDCVHLIKDDPPGFPQFTLDALEKVAFRNRQERHENAIHEKVPENEENIQEEEEEEEEYVEKDGIVDSQIDTSECDESDNDDDDDESESSNNSEDMKTESDSDDS
ncbi:hypothetical protein M9Y10_027719 [Tritrichomonas musculus]|uniref:Myotubularin phosphatase domain-containing protein n=1 Tax=Tritrichomonas musculus TaxID=1915356 RepID=A0ABR2H4V9_9EUKA